MSDEAASKKTPVEPRIKFCTCPRVCNCHGDSTKFLKNRSDFGAWHSRAVLSPNSIIYIYIYPNYLKQSMSHGKYTVVRKLPVEKIICSQASRSCVDISLSSFFHLIWVMYIRIIDQMLEPIFIKCLGILQTIRYIPSAKLSLQKSLFTDK